jgi:acylpyruvate hydrolase
MRLLTFRTTFGTRAGHLQGEGVTPLDVPDVGTLLALPDWRARVEAAEEPERPLENLDLAPVVLRPGKIICIGHNYRSHIEEVGADIPDYPTLFAKFAPSLIGPADELVIPYSSDQVDWEVELALVIGSTVRHADAEQAQAAIAGYTVSNDVSVRDWQQRTKQWLQGKTFERTTPLGPTLVTADEVDADDLTVRCLVDDEVKQEGNTSDLLFSPVDLVVYTSQILTLEPGDVILTGTPGGVGRARTPPEFLQPGQTLRSEVEGLGECVNPVVKEQEPRAARPNPRAATG